MASRVDLNSLVLFARVAEAGSFSSAARTLKMPLSTVSRRIAELEEQLGARLVERSTRTLRLTAIGTDVLEQARQTATVNDTVVSLVSHRTSRVAGVLRLSAVPSISDCVLVPVITAFQREYPDVRVLLLVTERVVDHIREDVDLVFRIGVREDSSLVSQRVLRYRHQLVASPAYLREIEAPEVPSDLHRHRLIAFSHMAPHWTWNFARKKDAPTVALPIEPHLSMNDFTGLAAALVAGAGIGDLPPIVRPDLLRDGHLVEVMPRWKFRPLDLAVVHLRGRLLSKTVRLFHDFAISTIPKLFPRLPQ